MENFGKKIRYSKALREQTLNALKGFLALCDGYDAQTRQEYIKELREVLSEQEAA